MLFSSVICVAFAVCTDPKRKEEEGEAEGGIVEKLALPSPPETKKERERLLLRLRKAKTHTEGEDFRQGMLLLGFGPGFHLLFHAR